MLDVHHIHAVSEGGSDAPTNLTVVCANHHCLIERLSGVEVIQSDETDDLVVSYRTGAFLIERDLSRLRGMLTE